ncbi:MAG: flagellar basal body L-ring protein FlgH [Armatimonadetes bacterium]|nr:flagellar basal body L-ring protein FlgH [Armatimonadota bacterium]
MYRICSLTLITVLAVTAGVYAESLWQADSKTSMFADKKAIKAGDILTVLIVESAASSSTASTDAKKDTKTEAGPGVGPLISNIPIVSYEGGDQLKASGGTSRTTKFTAKMTVTVKSINENGNFVIEGTRLVQTNQEKQEIKLTGTVRPQDIGPDNTVLSTAIADAKITHTGSGPIGSRQKEGIITKILRILF